MGTCNCSMGGSRARLYTLTGRGRLAPRALNCCAMDMTTCVDGRRLLDQAQCQAHCLACSAVQCPHHHYQ